jgi:hypothetical protein
MIRFFHGRKVIPAARFVNGRLKSCVVLGGVLSVSYEKLQETPAPRKKNLYVLAMPR